MGVFHRTKGVSALFRRARAARLLTPLVVRWRYRPLNFPSAVLAFRVKPP